MTDFIIPEACRKELLLTATDFKRMKSETLTEADFCTSHPNKYRISRIAESIHNYLPYKVKYNG